ncbi:MAG TPA: hypothetical protein VFF06_33020 [Polyangia bacterium]|nr:hypothetical protein [Polyangia bacterium]
MKRTATAALAVLALAAMEREARLSQLMYEGLSLEALVKDADVIVVARPDEPPRRTTKVSIVPEGKKPDAEKYPPYERVRTRWRIVEVLRGDKLAAGAAVEVDEAYFDMKLSLHREYYVKHIGKSPIFRRYAAPPADAAAPERILFLSRGVDGALRFTVDNGEESPAQKRKVAELIAADKPPR